MSPETIRLCRSLVEHFRLQFLKELRRPDLTDQQRQHYHNLVAEGSRAADELEREELAQ